VEAAPPPAQDQASEVAADTASKPKTIGDLFKKDESGDESGEKKSSWKIGDLFKPAPGKEQPELAQEEEVKCDCSFVIQGGCHSSPTGDGSPCGIQCCAPAEERVGKFADKLKGALGNAGDNIKNGLMGIKIPEMPKLPEKLELPELPKFAGNQEKAQESQEPVAVPAPKFAPAPVAPVAPEPQQQQPELGAAPVDEGKPTPLPGSAIKIEIPVWR